MYNFRTFPSRLSDMRADGVNYFDLSFLKNTEIAESLKLQVRGEF